MSLNQSTSRTLKTSLLLGAIVGLGFGCVLNLEPLEPCDGGSNNKLNDDGECVCRISYEPCEIQPSEDPMQLECCDDDDDVGDDEVGTTGTTDGTTDGTDTTDDGTTDDTTDDGTDTTDGETGTLPPDDCTEDQEGFYWCTHNVEMGPAGSQFFICEGGQWLENPTFMDESCQFDGFDFAYGCVDDGEGVVFECGVGSGDDCADDLAYCVDDDVIGYCVWGKETWESCQYFCENIGIEGVTYEYGECDDVDPNDVACYCCDSDDPECPING